MKIYDEQDRVLRGKNSKVSLPLSDELKSTIKEMVDHISDIKNDAVGIAAPQIGISQTFCVAVLSGSIYVLINPIIVKRSPKKEKMDESCLSVNRECGVDEEGNVIKFSVDVSRHSEVHVMTKLYDPIKDKISKPTKLILRGFDARVVQHEIDHLKGKLIVDYL